jgi:tetrathionate reductase subunit B
MSDQSNFDQYRRRFLGSSAALAGMALAPGVLLHEIGHAKPADTPVSGDVRWGMLIDSNKCATGCNDCVTACNEEHGLTGFDRPATDAQWIRKVTLKDKETGYTQTLRADGIVLVDKHICIGCRYCMMACPYKARSFIHEALHDQKPYTPRGKGTVESCTFCVHRVDNDEQPACVEACKAENHNAMVFGDLNDPSSEISQQLKKYNSRQIRADLQLNTGVRYRGI